MLDARKKAYLSAMGIDLWSAKDTLVVQTGRAEVSLASGEVKSASCAKIATHELDWPALAEAVSSCQACALHQTRTKTVFGVGNQQADLMVVGEAPGADEDRQGLPFVGRAGQLLTAMLAAINLPREQVYIANVLKCRPPGNRDPQAQEVAACQGYLDRQIALIKPRLILSVGGVSAKNLLNTEESVGRLRGRVHQYAPTGTPLMVTYHPAYLLRRPEEKAKAWIDLQAVNEYMS
jgi:uracil-DNA glycosylase family 4